MAQRNSKRGKGRPRQPESGTLAAEILRRWPDLGPERADQWAMQWSGEWIELDEIRGWWNAGFDYSGLDDMLRLKGRGMTQETMMIELNGRTVASLLRAGQPEVDIVLRLRELGHL